MIAPEGVATRLHLRNAMFQGNEKRLDVARPKWCEECQLKLDITRMVSNFLWYLMLDPTSHFWHFYLKGTCLLQKPTTTSCNVQTVQTYKMQKKELTKTVGISWYSQRFNMSSTLLHEKGPKVLVRKKKGIAKLLNHKGPTPKTQKNKWVPGL